MTQCERAPMRSLVLCHLALSLIHVETRCGWSSPTRHITRSPRGLVDQIRSCFYHFQITYFADFQLDNDVRNITTRALFDAGLLVNFFQLAPSGYNQARTILHVVTWLCVRSSQTCNNLPLCLLRYSMTWLDLFEQLVHNVL